MESTITKDTLYNVTNRSAGSVVYRIPDMNIRREFAPGETKKISYGELEALSYIGGGSRLMYDYLEIKDIAVTQQLNIHTEKEYWMEAEDIRKMLVEGSLDELLDCLDFAPDGVIDLVRKFAVELPLNDVAKREAIKEKTGFDVTKAIANMAPDEPETPRSKVAGGRRVKEENTVKEPEQPQRRVQNYKIVSQK